jgi:ADP-ribose pyrophosphatase
MSGFEELSRTVQDPPPGWWLRLGEVRVRTPAGDVVHRGYLHAPDAVSIVAVHAGALLLVREFRAAVGTEVTQVPGGKLAPGQDPAACARDELAEETGYAAGRIEPVGSLFAAPGWSNQLVYVCRATELTPLTARPDGGDPDDVEERHSSVVWLPLPEYGAAVRSGVIRDARTIAAVRLALD